MSYDHWKATDRGAEFLGDAEQKGGLSELELAAISLHDYLWANLGPAEDDEWPLSLIGADDALPEAVRLMNELQEAIKASGYARVDYRKRGVLR